MLVTLTNKNFLGKEIGFIKELRSAFGIGLKEAKEISDMFTESCDFDRLVVKNVDIPVLSIADKISYKNLVEVGATVDAGLVDLIKQAVDIGMYERAQKLIQILVEEGL